MAQGIIAEDGSQVYCSKCRKTMNSTNFYTYKDGSKAELCKGCMTLHINNTDPSTFMWLLEKFDVPWIPAEWNVLYERAMQKDPYKINGMSVFGKYLSKMKLKQWKNFTFADTQQLQLEAEQKAKLYGTPQEQMDAKIAEMKEMHERGEISDAQWMTYQAVTTPEINFQSIDGAITTAGPGDSPYPVNNPGFENVDLPDVAAELTDEDKIYLAMKWGRLYSAADWVSLEQLYNEYEKSFGLYSADLIAGTKQLCKIDLKANMALDSGDIDSYSKLARAQDSLRKSLKFTEAQRKDEKAEDFDCYGKMVAFAERYNDEDFIQPIDLSIDRDIVDTDIRDIKQNTQDLIKEDPAVYKMIEEYIKKRENLASQTRIEEDEDFELSDEDLQDFRIHEEMQREEDEDEFTEPLSDE